MNTKKLTTLPLRNSVNRAPLRRGFFLIALALTLASFALAPTARAINGCDEGCDPLANTWLGDGAFFINNNSICESDCPAGNTGIGFHALYNTFVGANNNTATGSNALFSNTSGDNNTATGVNSLKSNTTGISNTADGLNALFSNTTGTNNTANGVAALQTNTTGFSNTANGVQALLSNTTGANNTANGVNSLASNTTGFNDTATGVQALNGNTTGTNNTATGNNALFSNTGGANNTTTGIEALESNTTGSSNTADGVSALINNTTGSRNIALGKSAGSNLTTGNDNIDIGALGTASDAGTIRIGKTGTQNATFIAGISGVAVTGSQIVVNSNGRLGVTASSARFKEAIKAMDKASEGLLALKPVTFRYKKDLDPDGIPQFGLVAEEVEKVNPDLVVRDKEGKPYSVRYDQVNAMLLNEFLKEHRRVQEQEATIAQLKKDFRATVAQLATRLDEQAAQIQKVSARLEVNKPAPQMVLNNQ